jgi:glycine hydroxymethyltransferase
MIPSENYSSKAVREAVGSVAMHKYSEGYPGARYYEGNEFIDQIEQLAIDRARIAFKLPADWHVNVQPLAGANANLAVYNALLEPGDAIMGMYLYDGGHLSHGWEWNGRKVNITSRIYKSAFYHVSPESEVFDYTKIAKAVTEVKPKILISGGTAYPRVIDHTRMKQIAESVGAYYMADVAHEAGLIAAGVFPSPVGIADVVTMTTHKTLRGPKGAIILCRSELAEAIDKSIFPGMQGGPHNGTIAGIAQALFEAMQPEYSDYQKQVIANAQRLAELFSANGFRVISDGTDKHLVLVDTASKGIDGRKFARALAYAGIIVNKNTIPNDPKSPVSPSGIRLGTPFITTRGMRATEMEQIMEWILQVYELIKNDSELKFTEFCNKYSTHQALQNIASKVILLCNKFPLE